MQINPLNDKVIRFDLAQLSPTTGVESPVTSGTVTCIIASSSGPTATPAHGSFSFTAVHIGGANGFAAGKWQVFIDGAVLTAAILASLPAILYLIAEKSGDFRTVVQLENVAARYATVSS